MKKKIATIILSIIFLITTSVCMIIFSGCQKTCREGGEHLWKEEIDMTWLKGGELPHKDPTCTEDGYTDYYCNYCFKKKREVLPALGHNIVVDKEGVFPTCSLEGYEEISHCSTCNASLGDGSVLQKVPHMEQKVEADIAPTCTTTGLQSETRCADCGITVSQRKILPMTAHTPVIDIPAITPTCIQNGMTEKSHCAICGSSLSQQTVVPATTNKHNFDINNFKCADCGLINTQYKAITNAQELQNINIDLNGKYYLANNIDLKNSVWEPIGRGYGNFTGIFEGNGFCISNLNCSVVNNSSKKSTIGGLFEINSGKLINVTVANFTVNITFNEEEDNTLKNDHYGNVSATYGALAGENYGVIQNCSVSGSVKMTNTRILKKYIVWAKDGGNHTDMSYSYFGGLVGTNSGIISDCTNVASVNCTTSGFIQSMMGMFGGVNSGDIWNMLFIGDFGGIAGRSRSGGEISNCVVSGSVTFNSNLTANCISNSGVAGWECRIQNSMVVGSIIGTNGGKIQGCSSKKMNIARNHSTQGVTSKTKISDLIVNEGTNGFYGKNSSGVIGAIALLA